MSPHIANFVLHVLPFVIQFSAVLALIHPLLASPRNITSIKPRARILKLSSAALIGLGVVLTYFNLGERLFSQPSHYANSYILAGVMALPFLNAFNRHLLRENKQM
uniref:hypothetical protein n=1 Tax=Thaumasiovibrio occultus TaxID=1891184 RepID=UPI000B361915|nr:hypothetical protein [Thaumasiovibrio occultus]